jgi:hypothetical protein
MTIACFSGRTYAARVTVTTTEPPAVEAPRQRTRLTRHVGEVVGALRIPKPMVVVLSNGEPQWFIATPELVQRAWALQGKPVEVLTLQTPGGSDLSALGRLVRIDPASGAQAPDPATRARDMIRDWDELLHRLAQ